MNVEMLARLLADHDSAQPLRSDAGNYGLRCRCGLELWSPEEGAAFEMHRVHVATAIVRRMFP